MAFFGTEGSVRYWTDIGLNTEASINNEHHIRLLVTDAGNKEKMVCQRFDMQLQTVNIGMLRQPSSCMHSVSDVSRLRQRPNMRGFMDTKKEFQNT